MHQRHEKETEEGGGDGYTSVVENLTAKHNLGDLNSYSCSFVKWRDISGKIKYRIMLSIIKKRKFGEKYTTSFFFFKNLKSLSRGVNWNTNMSEMTENLVCFKIYQSLTKEKEKK